MQYEKPKIRPRHNVCLTNFSVFQGFANLLLRYIYEKDFCYMKKVPERTCVIILFYILYTYILLHFLSRVVLLRPLDGLFPRRLAKLHPQVFLVSTNKIRT